MGDLSEHFSRHEFACPCCGLNRVDRGLVDKLEAARRLYGYPIHITSGTRCLTHNAAMHGSAESSHLYGKAADLRCGNGTERYDLLMAVLTVGFARVGIGRDFLHVDIDYTKPQDTCWLY